MKVLIIEDGFEYSESFGRFLPGITWTRAGSGPEGLATLRASGFNAVFCDMRFDRIPDSALLGDLAATADQFNGDPVQARRHLQDHQGNYVVAAIRGAGISVPILLSHDFEGEPKRWARLVQRYAPIDHLPGDASPSEVERRLRRLAGA
jgi:hypothetical protein